MNGLFPISYILDPVEDDKNLYHDLICPCCLEDAKSAPSSELCEPAEQGSYFFQALRHEVSMFPGKHTFHGPQYSRPQLI